jgi:hypothetical protein
MNHEDRIQIAKRLTSMMIEKYGGDILLGSIFGSTARNTDTEHSDLEMLFIVKNESKAKSLEFAYKGMPVVVVVKKVAKVEKDIKEIKLNWPLKMGTLFNLKVTCGDKAILESFRKLLESVPQKKFDEFIAKTAPLCYEGLGRLKAVKIRGNVHEAGLFVAEVLFEFNLLVAIFNREFINHDYFGGFEEAFRFKRLPKDYEKIVRRLFNWTNLSLNETISLTEEFVRNFAGFMEENGIKLREHTPLEELEL